MKKLFGKKFLAALVLLLGMGTAKTFAVTGIGLQTGYDVGGGFPLAVTFKVQQVPCVFAANFGLGSGYFSVGATADWWIANPKIDGSWRWFYALGAAAGVSIFNNAGLALNIAPRAVIGTNYFINGSWEIYAQAAWQPTLGIVLSDGGSGGGFKLFNIPANIGFRYWF